MHTFIEILQLIGIIFGFLVVLCICAFLHGKNMTDEEKADYADSFDEFLYGEKFR